MRMLNPVRGLSILLAAFLLLVCLAITPGPVFFLLRDVLR
jgi:threonine/homoserine/homoserine lactone efflux protein